MKVEKPVESVTAAEQKEDDSGLTYCKAYFQAFLVCCSFGLGVHSYYTLAGVQTSLHELKGSVGLALVWFFFILSAILTPVCFRIIGLKATYVLGVLGYCVYPLSNFYDGWFTIVPGFVFVGLASGPLCAGASTYMTVVAEGLVERYGNVGEKYRGIFQGLAMMSIFGGAMFGNGLLSVFLYHDLDNTTNFTTNISTLDNQTFRTNSSYLDAQSLFSNDSSVCSRDVGITSVSYLYYYLIGVCLFLTVLATILSTFLINTGNRVACSQVPSELCSSLKRTVKMFLQLKYIIPVTLVFYTGVDQGFFFGQFTLHFVSTCLGLGAVGLAVIVYCFGVMLSSLSVGWISIHLTRTLVVVVSAFLQAGMILFMLFWEREASYVMVFLTSLGWGIVDGVWMTLPAIYVGIVAKPLEAKAAFGIVKGFLAFGGMMNFFVSAYIPVNVNLWIILSVLVVAVAVYLVGEKVFTPSKFCKDKGEYDLKSDLFGKEGQKPLELVFSPMPETVTVVAANSLFIDDDKLEDVVNNCTGDMDVAKTIVKSAMHEKT